MSGVDLVELVVDARCLLAEGPVWDERQQVLRWVDITGARVHRFDPGSGQHTMIDVDQPVGALALRDGGGVVLAVRDGFAFLDEASGQLDLVAPVEADDPGNRMNDGKCDRRGRFWAGTTEFEHLPHRGTLYSLEFGGTAGAELSVQARLGGLTISNGLAWSPDDTRFYFVDTPTRRVDVADFDLDTGTLGDRRPLVEVPEGAGSPDGMTVDDDGCLWVALWSGGAVRRYTPDGVLDRVLELPVTQVTCCTFGGPDRDVLYITSARKSLSDGELAAQPQAGGVFAATVGVTGPPPARFAG